MALDFSGLFDGKKNEEPKAADNGAMLEELLKNGASPNPYIAIEQEAAARAATLEEYRRLQAARSHSSQKQTELLKSIAAGESPAELVILALECISAATGNGYYKTAATQQFLDIYGGDGLQDPDTVQIELRQVEARLERLRQSAQRETNENIKRAIRAHEAKAEELRGILK